MDVPQPHIDLIDPQDAAFARVLGGMGDVLRGAQEKYVRCAEEKRLALEQLESQTLPVPNIVAEGMQNEFIAIFNAMHARGMVTCSKKEFIERMANALGCPQMANNYSGQLYKIKLTNKYETIFEDLSDVAQQEKMKDN
jgi:hypothetical protein